MTEIGMALSNPYEGTRRPGAVGRPLPGVSVKIQEDGRYSEGLGTGQDLLQTQLHYNL